MSTKTGRNQKWNVCPQTRTMLRGVFEVLGVKASPMSPTSDLYTLSDGCNVGVFEYEDALDPAQARKGAWLEVLVEDPDATASALGSVAGVTRLEYTDKEHAYFQAGASPVFRIARA